MRVLHKRHSKFQPPVTITTEDKLLIRFFSDIRIERVFRVFTLPPIILALVNS